MALCGWRQAMALTGMTGKKYLPIKVGLPIHHQRICSTEISIRNWLKITMAEYGWLLTPGSLISTTGIPGSRWSWAGLSVRLCCSVCKKTYYGLQCPEEAFVQ